MTDSAPREQCACERLGITPGVRGHQRCPGCPKAEPPVAPPPASPEPRYGYPAGRDDLRVPACPEPMPEGWESDSRDVWHNPDPNPENAYNARWWGAHHNGIYVEGYDSAVVVPLPVLRALLATQGLRIVDEASAKVLEACAALTEPDLVELHHQTLTRGAVAETELARREKEKRNG